MASIGGRFDLGKLELTRKVCKTLCRRFTVGSSCNQGSASYYVLLPEVPPDTKESNPILRVEDYPKFSEISPDLCISGSAKRAIEFDVEIGSFFDTLKERRHNLSFDDIFNPLEKSLVALNYALKTTKHLNYVHYNTPYTDAFKRAYPQVENAKNQRWMNSDLYLSIKELNLNNKDELNEAQKRLVEKYLLEGKFNGVELSGENRSKFISHLFRLAELKNHFRNRVLMTSNMFSHTVEDFRHVSEFPRKVLSQISTNRQDPMKGPWRLTFNQGLYDIAMAHCSDRMIRWNLWYAYNNRASRDHDTKNLSNHKILEEIRVHRNDLAKFLNYPTYADMSMETKMAGSVDKVRSFIDLLKQRFQPVAQAEMAKLQEFAKSEGFQHSLEAWDVPYWRRRMLDHHNKLDLADLKNYFPLPRVLEFLFTYCRILFGLRFEEHTRDVDVWNEHVKFYKVYDDESNQQLSAMYLDPYARPREKLGGTWMEPGRDRCGLIGVTPFSYFCLNLEKPEAGKPCLVPFSQLQHIFFQFGHGLQQLASTAPYSEVSGQRNIEWDSLDTCSNLLKMILNTRQTLRSMSRHHETGQPLSEDIINTIMRRRHHMSSYDNIFNLYHSALDIELHTKPTDAYTLMQNTWKEYMPINMDKDDYHICSLTSLFSDLHPAAYYSHKWSEMLACDIFKTFRNASKEGPDSLQVVGKKFRDSYLALGGSVPAAEVFRRLQGRDPNPDALVSYHLH